MPNKSKLSIGIEVDKKDAERIRKILINKDLIDYRLEILKIGDKVIFPIKNSELDKSIELELENVRVDFFNFSVKEYRPRNLKEALTELLEKKQLSLIPSSYDIIGDIAIIQLKAEIEPLAKEIAIGIMKVNPSIKVVLGEKGRVSGPYRLTTFIHLLGDERTWTIHKENSCVFELDVSRVYFSPRLATERRRLIEQVKKGELVIDMFAGIGPFSIEIARHKNAKVKAIELNPTAYEYLKRNISINRVENLVEPIFGDAAEIVPKIGKISDRIIMNYPADSLNYLEHAVEAARRGGTIHIYGFAASMVDWVSKVESKLKKLGVERYEIAGKIVREVAPRRYNVVADIRLL